MNQCPTSFSCASAKRSFFLFAICSHRLLIISSDVHWREDNDSWIRRTRILDHTKRIKSNSRSSNKRLMEHRSLISKRIPRLMETRRIWRTSKMMKNQKTSKVKKRIWNNIWTSWTRELIHWSRLWNVPTPWWRRWETRKPLLNRSTIRRRVRSRMERPTQTRSQLRNISESKLTRRIENATIPG